MPKSNRNLFVPILLLAAGALLIVAPFQLSGYWVRVLTNVFMFATLAQAADLITGWTGYAALGNVAFFGLGAYAVGVAMHAGIGFYPSLAIAGILAALVALVVGLPILRTKGHYFVMATIGLNEVIRALIVNLEFTGGGKGMTLPVPPLRPPALYTYFYFIMLAIMVACLLTTYIISKRPLGYGLRAIRADEEAANVMGVPTVLLKSTAWSISAFYTALAGGVFAYWTTFIEVPVVFDVMIGIKFFVMLLLGGMGTVLGPALGAFVVEFLGEVVWDMFPMYHLASLGIGIVLIVLLIPGGLMETLRARKRRQAAVEEESVAA